MAHACDKLLGHGGTVVQIYPYPQILATRYGPDASTTEDTDSTCSSTWMPQGIQVCLHKNILLKVNTI